MAWEVIEDPNDPEFTPVGGDYYDPTDAYNKGADLPGRVERTPRVILGRSVEDVPGLVEPGNFDLTDPSVFTKDTFHIDDGGLRVVIPRVFGGVKVDRPTATRLYQKNGGNLGMFKDKVSADEYVANLNKWQEASTPQRYGLSVLGVEKDEDLPRIQRSMGKIMAGDQTGGRPELAPSFLAPMSNEEDRIDVPELDQSSSRFEVVDEPAAQQPVRDPAQRAAGRQELIDAIGWTESLGYPVSHKIGTADEPEGDRSPTRDMENLVKTLKEAEADTRKIPGRTILADKFAAQRSYWEGNIQKFGMTQEQEDKSHNLRSKLYPGEDKYFKAHPEVAGMAAEDNKVILNPYSPPGVNKDAVIKNEGFRIKLRENGTTPDFEITPEQRKAFAGTPYGQDDKALKETIAARIYSGDPSAKATPEQQAWVAEFSRPPTPARTDRDIPIYDPTNMEVVDEKALPPTERNPANFEAVSPVSPHLLNFVKGYEGWDSTAKWDYKQYSVGYGTRAKYPGEQISKEEGERRLEEELTQSANGIDAAIEKSGMKLDPNQRDALISFDYNTGRGADLISTSKNPDEIRDRLVQYNQAGGRVLPGLVERRQDEATLFNGGSPPPRPDQAPETTSALGRMAGIPKMPEEFSMQRTYDAATAAKESAFKALEGFKGSLQGSSAAVSKYVYKPIFGGIQNAIHTLAPDSELSKYTLGLYNDFNQTFVEQTGAQARAKRTPKEGETTLNQISQQIGGLVADIGTAVPTGRAIEGLKGAEIMIRGAEAAAPTVFNVVKQHLPRMGEAAASFAIPALRSGMDAQDMAARMGASPADQNLAFSKAALLTMGTAALPMGVESKAANVFQRFVERAAKATPLGVGTTAAVQGAENILSPGEAQPFDPKQLSINSIPIVLLAAALGRNVRAQPRGPIAEQAFPKAETTSMPGGEIMLAPRAKPADGLDLPLSQRTQIVAKEVPSAEVGPPAVGPPEVIPPRTPILKQPPPISNGPTPRIKPILGAVKKAKAGKISLRWPWPFEADLMRTMQGTAEIFEKSGFPALGQAVRNHMDQFRRYMAMTGAPIRNWAQGSTVRQGADEIFVKKPITRAEMNAAHEEFKNYWQSVDERWQAINNAMGGLEDTPVRPLLEGDQRFAPGAPRSGLKAQIESAENQLSALAGQGGDFISQLRAKKDELGWDEQTYLNRMRRAIDNVTGQTREEPPGLPGPQGVPATAPGPVQPSPSEAIYNAASLKGKELIDIWKKLGDKTGDIAVKNGLEVFDHDKGTWRPFHKIGGGRFFPRRLSPYWIEVFNKPEQYPEAYAEIRREILAKGYVDQLSEVDGYIKRALKQHTPNDLSPLEHARTSPLPTRVYDYSFDQALNYLRNFSWDMARIEAFGQKKFGDDLFTQAQGETTDTYSKNYIKRVQDISYRKQNQDAWFSPINIATNVSTFNMLGNYLSSMRNAIGGVLYNAQYNGVLTSSKALAQVHKMAGAIDDAYELGILQDNLHNLQQDVHNLTPEGQKRVGQVLKWSGYQKVEEWTRAMNLLTARDFLRKAINDNQNNPASWTSIQNRARIQRVGGIDPEALLREGGTGPVTERFLRQNVGHIQGGYGYDQTPAWANSPGGRFLLQFQKWGTQAADTFVKNVANPAVQAISLGKVGKQETVQIPNPNGSMRTVKVPGNILPAARFLLLATAAGLTQKELQHFIFGIEDKEASFAEILSRTNQGDAKAFGELLHKVFMAQISVGAAGIIGNYAQLGVDIANRTRFKDITAPPGLAAPKAILQLIMDGISQGKLTKRDFDTAAANINSGYRTLKGAGARLNDAFGGEILPLKVLSAQRDVSWLRSVTRRYDTLKGVEAPTIMPGMTGKNPLTPFTNDLKEALMMGDSLRASDLLDAHLDPLSPSARKVEMERIMSSVRGSSPIRVGGGTGEAMRANFLEWADDHLPIMDVLRIHEIDGRYRDTAIGLHLLNPKDPDARERDKALKRLEDRAAIRAGK